MAKNNKKRYCKHRILFICRKSDYHFGHRPHIRTTGLRLSAGFCAQILEKAGHLVNFVIVNDNNDVDREVHKFKPTHVVIEALWVVPSKFEVLQRLHPDVTWIVRLHSEVPFMANEGCSMEWIPQYLNFANVYVAVNSDRMLDTFRAIYPHPEKIVYLPNCYIYPKLKRVKYPKDPNEIQVACFGAVRPLKNQLIQATSAMEWADSLGKRLVFHINGDRIEQEGNPVLKNIYSLFAAHPVHNLVQYEWLEHLDLLELLQTMDVGMQVSLTESFNHMTADHVAAGLPSVVSHEVRWMPYMTKCSANSQEDIVNTLDFVWRHGWWVKKFARFNLTHWAEEAEETWLEFFWQFCDEKDDKRPHRGE